MLSRFIISTQKVGYSTAEIDCKSSIFCRISLFPGTDPSKYLLVVWNTLRKLSEWEVLYLVPTLSSPKIPQEKSIRLKGNKLYIGESSKEERLGGSKKSWHAIILLNCFYNYHLSSQPPPLLCINVAMVLHVVGIKQL